MVVIYKSRFDPLSEGQSQIPPSPDFFPDEPIVSQKEDFLGRAGFAKEYYNRIAKYPFSDPFVFSLYGAWGEGKTSALNLVKDYLYQDNEIIVYEFDPWFYSGSDGIAKGFYEGLHAALNNEFFFPNILRDIHKYQKVLSSGLKLSGINFDFGFSKATLDELKEKIQQWIFLTGKKIVILIDDIDRLEKKDDILLVFKTTKTRGKI